MDSLEVRSQCQLFGVPFDLGFKPAKLFVEVMQRERNDNCGTSHYICRKPSAILKMDASQNVDYMFYSIQTYNYAHQV